MQVHISEHEAEEIAHKLIQDDMRDIEYGYAVISVDDFDAAYAAAEQKAWDFIESTYLVDY